MISMSVRVEVAPGLSVDQFEDALGCRMYHVTLGDGSVSRIAAASLLDCRQRVLEINSRAVILGIQETRSCVS